MLGLRSNLGLYLLLLRRAIFQSLKFVSRKNRELKCLTYMISYEGRGVPATEDPRKGYFSLRSLESFLGTLEVLMNPRSAYGSRIYYALDVVCLQETKMEFLGRSIITSI